MLLHTGKYFTVVTVSDLIHKCSVSLRSDSATHIVQVSPVSLMRTVTSALTTDVILFCLLLSYSVVLHACNGHEWFRSRSKVSHKEAVKACHNVGFYLQSPTNQSDRKCSKSKFPRLFSDRFWTGFHRDPVTPTSFHYEWYGKQHSIAQDAISWDMNEGQNVNEMCVAQLYNSRHADLPCTELAYYICQRRPSK